MNCSKLWGFSLVSSLFISFIISSVAHAWTVDSLGYTHRKKITIDHTYIDSDLTAFPLLVKFTNDSDLAEANSDGHDIRFTSSDGTTEIPYERQTWSGGGGSNVTATFWVKATLTGASNTDIYVYYRSLDTADGQDAINAWDSSFKAVWHFEQAGNATQEESTTNNNDGTPANMEAEDSVTGKIGQGLDLDGSAEYVNAQSPATLDNLSVFTASAWIKADTLPTSGWMDVAVKASNSQNETFFLYIHGDVAGAIGTYKGRATTSSIANSAAGTLTTGTWYYVTSIQNITGSAAPRMLVNGAEPSYSTQQLGSGLVRADATASLYLGSETTPPATFGEFDGIIDELRISNAVRADAWVKFEYRNMSEADNEILIGSEETDFVIDSGTYTTRKKITIDHTNIDSDLTDFPVLIEISNDSDMAIANADGFDIRFTTNDGITEIPYERQSWSGGNGSNVTATFWVQADLAGAANTDIYIYYRSTDTADGANPTAVWDSNFRGVWHLEEDGNVVKQDSTGNNLDLNVSNAENTDDVAAITGIGMDLDGSNEYMNNTTGLGISGHPYTIEAWFNPDTAGSFADPLSLCQAGANIYGSFIQWNSNTFYAYTGENNTYAASTRAGSSGAWNHVVGIYTTTASRTIYVNSAAGSTETTTKNAGTPDEFLVGAFQSSGGIFGYFDGKVDEVRVSSVARTDAWIKFTYYNMNEADNEISLGAEEDLSGGGGGGSRRVFFTSST